MQKKNLPLVIIYGLIAIPVLLWVIASPVADRFSSLSNFFRSLGQLLALTGFSMYAINLLIASRINLVDKIFGGLNFAYKRHHLNGELALIFILFHPVSILLSRFFISPTLANDFLFGFWGQWDLMFGKIALSSMVILLFITIYMNLKYHIWKFSHKFLGITFLIAIIHTLFVSSDITYYLPLRLFMYMLAGLAALAVFYRVIFPAVLVKKFRYSVSKVEEINKGILKLIFKPDGNPINFLPGQFVYLTVPSLDNEEHPFSISSSPKERTLELLIKELGDHTELLRSLKNGTKVLIEGPFGSFSYLNQKGTDQLWISGGIGIAPFISMAKYLLRYPFRRDIIFVHSVGNRREMVFNDLVTKVFGSRFILHESSKSGHLNFSGLKKFAPDIFSRHIFICGPKAMNKSLKLDLLDNGVTSDNIHIEDFEL